MSFQVAKDILCFSVLLGALPTGARLVCCFYQYCYENCLRPAWIMDVNVHHFYGDPHLLVKCQACAKESDNMIILGKYLINGLFQVVNKFAASC